MAKRFTVQGRNTDFTCCNCQRFVPALVRGGCRNHCPYCLHSLHVDINPGDRASDCQGVLEPVAVEQHPKKGWMILSRCQRCGELKRNKAALDDPVADDFERIIALSQHQGSV